MTAQTKVSNDPALALCFQLTTLLDEEARLVPLWSLREQAMLGAAPDDKDQAIRDFDAIDGTVAELQHRIEALVGRITSLPAESLQGAIAKLRGTLRYGSPKTEPDEFPWPQIQSVLRDLDQLAANDNACLTNLPTPRSVESRDQEGLPERKGL